MDFKKLVDNLIQLEYNVTEFQFADEAVKYLSKQIHHQTVGIGGSVTIEEMKLYDNLILNNEVFWHMRNNGDMDVMDTRKRANQADIYICSVNGIAETGEIVNIDYTGNRVASISFGHKKVYLVIGENKIKPTLEEALNRARNVASPLNAKRLGVNTPCAISGDRCYDCKSPERICRNLSILWKKPAGCEYEIILIHQKLGY